MTSNTAQLKLVTSSLTLGHYTASIHIVECVEYFSKSSSIIECSARPIMTTSRPHNGNTNKEVFMSEVPALSIQNLSKTYSNGFSALKDVSLTVPQGGFFALLGPTVLVY